MNFILFYILIATLFYLVACTIKITTDNDTIWSAFLNMKHYYRKPEDNTMHFTEVNPVCRTNLTQKKHLCRQVLEAFNYKLDEEFFLFYKAMPCHVHEISEGRYAFLLRCPSSGISCFSYYVSYGGGYNETSSTTNMFGFSRHGYGYTYSINITYRLHAYYENVEVLRSIE